MLLSATKSYVPPIREIQEKLVDAGMMKADRVGSSDWIEPPHAAALLPSTHGALDAVGGPSCYCDLYATLEEQFRERKLPAMVDDSIKAYCVAGLRSRVDNAAALPTSMTIDELADVEVLVFDPHMPTVPSPSSIGSPASAVRWVGFLEFFRDEAKTPKWMYCCPLGASKT